jgi:hypothetical protein
MMYFISYWWTGYNSSSNFANDIIRCHPLEWQANDPGNVLISWQKIPEDEEHDVEKFIFAKKRKEEEKHSEMMDGMFRVIGSIGLMQYNEESEKYP